MDIVPSLEIQISTWGDSTEFSTELEKYKACIAQIDLVKTISVCRCKELIREVKQRQTKEVSVRK